MMETTDKIIKEYLLKEYSLLSKIENLQKQLIECLKERKTDLEEMLSLKKELNKYKYPLKVTDQKEKKAKVVLFQKNSQIANQPTFKKSALEVK